MALKRCQTKHLRKFPMLVPATSKKRTGETQAPAQTAIAATKVIVAGNDGAIDEVHTGATGEAIMTVAMRVITAQKPTEGLHISRLHP
jgi:hypothetical protein